MLLCVVAPPLAGRYVARVSHIIVEIVWKSKKTEKRKTVVVPTTAKPFDKG
jgi:hypothetical protein